MCSLCHFGQSCVSLDANVSDRLYYWDGKPRWRRLEPRHGVPWDKRWHTTTEAGVLLGMKSRNAVIRLIAAGELEAIRTPADPSKKQGQYRIPAKSVIEFQRRRAVRASAKK